MHKTKTQKEKKKKKSFYIKGVNRRKKTRTIICVWPYHKEGHLMEFHIRCKCYVHYSTLWNMFPVLSIVFAISLTLNSTSLCCPMQPILHSMNLDTPELYFWLWHLLDCTFSSFLCSTGQNHTFINKETVLKMMKYWAIS